MNIKKLCFHRVLRDIENIQRQFLHVVSPRSHAIIPIERCPNAMPPADEISQVILRWMKAHKITSYNEETHTKKIFKTVFGLFVLPDRETGWQNTENATKGNMKVAFGWLTFHFPCSIL